MRLSDAARYRSISASRSRSRRYERRCLRRRAHLRAVSDTFSWSRGSRWRCRLLRLNRGGTRCPASVEVTMAGFDALARACPARWNAVTRLHLPRKATDCPIASYHASTTTDVASWKSVEAGALTRFERGVRSPVKPFRLRRRCPAPCIPVTACQRSRLLKDACPIHYRYEIKYYLPVYNGS